MAYTDPIIQRLNTYRRRVFFRRLLVGGLNWLLTLAALFLVGLGLEHLFWFPPMVRTVFYWVFLVISVVLLGYWVGYPLYALFNLDRVLSLSRAGQQVGQQITDLGARLVNYLQLHQLATDGNMLAGAALTERQGKLRHIDFDRSVSFRAPLYILLAGAGIALVYGLVLVISPAAFETTATRLIQYNQHFTPPPPYRLVLSGVPDTVLEGERFRVQVEVAGDKRPELLYVYRKSQSQNDYQPYLVEPDSLGQYSYGFEPLYEAVSFYVGDGQFGTETKRVFVKQRPDIQQFRLTISPPAYTRLPAEVLPANLGDALVPLGSTLRWELNGNEALQQPSLQLKYTGDTRRYTFQTVEDQTYSTQLQARKPFLYSLQADTNLVDSGAYRYSIKVNPDNPPLIQFQAPSPDFTVDPSGIAELKLLLQDDYGLRSAQLEYRIVSEALPENQGPDFQPLPLNIESGNTALNVEHRVDVLELGLPENGVLEYRIRASDNNAVQGSQTTVSRLRRLRRQSVDQLFEQQEAGQDSVSSGMSKSLAESDQANKELEELKRLLQEKRNLEYADQQQVDQTLEKQKEQAEKLEQLNKQQQQKLQEAQENQLYSEQTRAQMERIQQLSEEIEPETYRKFLENFQDSANQMNKQQLQEKMEEMERKNENLQRQLKRVLELMKRLKQEQLTDEVIQRLQQLEQKQAALENQTETAGGDQQKLDSLAQVQEKLNQEAKKVDEQMKELQKMDQEQNDGQPSEDMQEAMEENQQMQQSMDKAQQQLEQQQGGGAKQNQQKAQQKMQQMRNKLSAMQQQRMKAKQTENYEDLRRLLENLLKVSFDQEEVRDQVKALKYNDPALPEVVEEQNTIRTNMLLVEDSLVALANRVAEIETKVLDELENIDRSMDRSFKRMRAKQLPAAQVAQHSAMTSMNNLANMLVESLDNMQMQMQMSGKGSGSSCPMPMPMPGMQQLGQQQMKLNGQMQQMLDEQGGMNPGKLGQMAKEQARIRKSLQEMFRQIREGQGKGKAGGDQEGQGLGSMGKILDSMEETEEELKLKQLTQETLQRQHRLLDRLLDYNKAMREREFEKRRASKTGKEQEKPAGGDWQPEELKQRISQDLLELRRYPYSPTYQQLINRYLKTLQR